MNAERFRRSWMYVQSRLPVVGRWLRHRTARKLAADGSPTAIRVLAEEFVSNNDPEVTTIALEALRRVQNVPCINAACEVWFKSRDIRLEELMISGKWVGTSAPEIHVLTALKTHQIDQLFLVEFNEDLAGAMVDACLDGDDEIAHRAKLALSRVDTGPHRRILANSLSAKWIATRSRVLDDLIVEGNYVADSPMEAMVITALKTKQRRLITDSGVEVASTLWAARVDKDPTIAAQAMLALGELTDVAARAAIAKKLCPLWVKSRAADIEDILTRGKFVATEPILTRVLTALKTNNRAILVDLSSEIIEPLFNCHQDQDEVVREQARLAVGDLKDHSVREAVIDLVCQQWNETRSNDLATAIKQGGYVATQPLDLRILTALKASQRRSITRLGPEVVPALMRAIAREEPEISEQARSALRELKTADAKDAVCQMVLENDDPVAGDAAVAGKYAPKDEHQRALFFFLTEQWERYDAFDFDRRLLFSVYELANNDLRQRITSKLRASGRTDFLTILAGHDFRQRATVMAPDEINFLVEMLERKEEWQKLWNLVFDLPFIWSLKVIRSLARLNWQPSNDLDVPVFKDLVRIAASELVSSEKEISQLLPPAACQAKAYIASRANTVAFSPCAPIIAIGTSNRKVGLWDFKRGRMERIISGFGRSVGRVTFLPDSTLLCAERTNDAYNRCVLRYWKNNRLFSLKETLGSLTAVEAASSERALIAGRDQSVELWDVNSRHAIRKSKFDVWARGLTVSPNGDMAALLYDGLTLIGLPEMDVRASTGNLYPDYWTGVARCAAFAPGDGQTLIAGKVNGQVLALHRQGPRLRPDAAPVCVHSKSVQSIQVSTTRSIIITGGAEGIVKFISWRNRAVIGTVAVPGERLTSLHISPDEDFMAIGDTDASISFWDLRLLDIPMMFALPLAKAVPNHFAAITTAVAERNLRPEVLRALQFIQIILRHRFRYDIEVDELTTIRRGTYDIVIEG